MTTYTRSNRSARPAIVREDGPGYDASGEGDATGDDAPKITSRDAAMTPTRIEREVDGETRTYLLVEERAVRQAAARAGECASQAEILADRLTALGPERIVETTSMAALKRQLRALHDAIRALTH